LGTGDHRVYRAADRGHRRNRHKTTQACWNGGKFGKPHVSFFQGGCRHGDRRKPQSLRLGVVGGIHDVFLFCGRGPEMATRPM
jgi:hypothetical protein